MHARTFVIAALIAGCSAPALAQGVSAQCPAGGSLSSDQRIQDACQKSIDLFAFMAPQLGTSLAGGNATLGQASTLAGLGHFSIGLRANVLKGALPQVNQIDVSTTGAVKSDFSTKDQILGLPTVDAAVGVYKGFPLGITHIGGVDALVSATYLPNYETNDIKIETGGSALKFGYGARVGILQESLLVPGLSVTWLKRDLPSVDITGNIGGANDTIAVNDLQLKSTAWRVVASKSFLIFGLAGGYGKDKYESSADLLAVVDDGLLSTRKTIAFDQDLSRSNIFLDLSINVLMLKLVGEIGRVSGGSVPTYNTFGSHKADDAYTYGSVGFRVGF